MGTQLIGPPCPESLAVHIDADDWAAPTLEVRCRLLLDHPLSIHTGEVTRMDGSRLVVSWGEG